MLNMLVGLGTALHQSGQTWLKLTVVWSFISRFTLTAHVHRGGESSFSAIPADGCHLVQQRDTCWYTLENILQHGCAGQGDCHIVQDRVENIFLQLMAVIIHFMPGIMQNSMCAIVGQHIVYQLICTLQNTVAHHTLNYIVPMALD